MAELKTKATTQKAEDFLNTVEPVSKRQDCFELLELFKKTTGEKPVMWGTSIVGFGKYHYKSERSAQEGDWPLTGFSPRKQALTLYVTGVGSNQGLLTNLGKHKTSGGCLYIKRLSDIDIKVLEKLISASFQYMKRAKK